MFDLWKETLTEEERDKLLDKAASEILRRKLEMPAVLFFQMHKPLAYVGSHAALAFAPFLIPFFGFENVDNYTRLLSDRENVELLMQKLEKHGDDAQFGKEVACS